jgi:cystathionine beta-lyase family protein involved in aluminum resistance
MREPYAVYFQGGLTYQHAKFGIVMTLQKMIEKKLIEL